MVDKINAITLVFENVDSMSIPADEIVAWRIGEVTTNLFGGRYGDGVHKSNSCNFFEITISNKFLNSVYVAGYKGVNSKTTNRTRLDFADIAAVELEYIDGAVESYYVPWEDGIEGSNPYQCRDGNTITICNNNDCGGYEESAEHIKPKSEAKSKPKANVCDVCGRECEANGVSLLNPDGSTFKNWHICDKCAKSIWDGIRYSIAQDVMNRHTSVENNAMELKFLFDNNMLHTTPSNPDWLDRQVEMSFGMDMSKILSEVMRIADRQ